MTPIEASKQDNGALAWANLYKGRKFRSGQQRWFKLGDVVRLVKNKNVFEKGFTPNSSQEKFKVIDILLTNPTTYRIASLDDVHDPELKDTFYENELCLVR